MKKTYKNPPLMEAVCEFRFVIDTNPSPEQVNLFYQQIKSSFPVAKKKKMHQVEFRIEAEKTEEENKKNFNQNFYEFDLYLSEDEKYSVQLDRSRVSIHRVKPYTSWGDFSSLIENVYKTYIKVFSPKAIGRIGVRYINEISVPIENFSFSDYFTIDMSLPSMKNSKQMSIFLGSVFEQENGVDALKVQFVEKQMREPISLRTFIADFDYFLIKPATINFSEVDKWLEKAHTNLENTFEGIITDTTRELFNKK